jgi:hypothetical protein
MHMMTWTVLVTITPGVLQLVMVLGLPEYVSSTTSHDHKRAYNNRSTINTGGALHQHSNLTQAKSPPGLNLILSWYSHGP